MARALVSTVLAAALSAGFAAPARAELASWDQAKVTALAKQLDAAAQDLYDTFYKQPKPTLGQERSFYRLKQDIRHIKNDARQLSRELEKGAGREETQPSYEDLMVGVRRAQDNAMKVFTTTDLQQKAGVARNVLNQLTPYYDAAAKPLEPVKR